MSEPVILIPTFFGGQMVLNCLTGVLARIPNAHFTVYKNTDGWLKACNKLMLESTSDVILLNDDTIPITNLAHEMKTLAYSDPKIGIVGGKALAADQETVINYGIYISADGNTAHKYYGKRRTEVTEVEEQKAVEGSCIFIKREVINKIGVFDEGYGMGYREELDFAFRAREVGYKVVSCPTAEYVHLTSQTNSRLGIHNDTYDYFMSKWGRKIKLGEI